MRKSYARRQLLIFVFFLIFLVIGIGSLYIGLNTKKIVSLKYQEDNDIDTDDEQLDDAFDDSLDVSDLE